MELKASGRFISDAFLRVSLSNLSSSKVLHFVLAETSFTKYCISSNRRSQHLNEVVKCDTYLRVALLREALISKLGK